MLPDAMNPIVVAGEAAKGHPFTCPGCGKTFDLATGVIWETYYGIGDTIHYGKLPFCTLACLVAHCTPRGEA